MSVLNVALGSGESNRLSAAIRGGQSLAHTVGSFYRITVGDSYLAAEFGVLPDAVDTALATLRAISTRSPTVLSAPPSSRRRKRISFASMPESEERADWTAYWLG